jgi:hypothetical protein
MTYKVVTWMVPLGFLIKKNLILETTLPHFLLFWRYHRGVYIVMLRYSFILRDYAIWWIFIRFLLTTNPLKGSPKKSGIFFLHVLLQISQDLEIMFRCLISSKCEKMEGNVVIPLYFPDNTRYTNFFYIDPYDTSKLDLSWAHIMYFLPHS